jgi:hypothetical protein
MITNREVKVFKVEMGYNGCDISDTAISHLIEPHRLYWYLELLEAGFKVTNPAGWFINFGNEKNWLTVSKRYPLDSISKDEWPEPFVKKM